MKLQYDPNDVNNNLYRIKIKLRGRIKLHIMNNLATKHYLNSTNTLDLQIRPDKDKKNTPK